MKKGMELKKEIVVKTGLSSKDLSVTYDGSYRITLKKIYPKSKVEKIANIKQSIRYDEMTGEILQGANTFVFVQYEYDLEVPEEFKQKILNLKNKIDFGDYCDDSSKLYHYSTMLKEELGNDWDENDCRALIGIDWKIQRELVS